MRGGGEGSCVASGARVFYGVRSWMEGHSALGEGHVEVSRMKKTCAILAVLGLTLLQMRVQGEGGVVTHRGHELRSGSYRSGVLRGTDGSRTTWWGVDTGSGEVLRVRKQITSPVLHPCRLGK